MKKILDVLELAKSYQMNNTIVSVFEGISFYILEKEIVALLGPSGSGKTTLLSILGTLIRPSVGEVLFNNKSLFFMDENELSRFINK